jgi:molybdopterin-binding protein
MLILDNANISFDNFTLNSGHLEFEKGRIYCLTGPNGSGKSTLLKMIGLQLVPQSGTVRFNGKIVDYSNGGELLENRRKISYMLQDGRLFHRSVFENAACALKLRSIQSAVIKEKVNTILERLEISHLANRSIHGLSGGEAQRVRLARCLALDTAVYILDEPSAGLDARGRELVSDILSLYNKEKGATVIFTSHHKEEAYRLSPDILAVNDGSVTEIPHENIMTGTAEKAGEKLYSFSNGNIRNLFFFSDQEIKNKVSLAIDPEEIILSLSEVRTSARNCLSGIIKEIKDTHSGVQLTIASGENFSVLITKNSLKEMDLSSGSKVYLLFKATAVKVVNQSS